MSGFLETYGVKEARREAILKRIALAVVLALVVGSVLYFQFRDYREKKQVQTFLELLEKGDYKAAYALWGCTEENPCRDYSFEKFMQDWGPESGHSSVKKVEIARTRSCEEGIIQTLRFGDEEVWLYVDRQDHTLAYSPWPICNPRIPKGSLRQ